MNLTPHQPHATFFPLLWSLNVCQGLCLHHWIASIRTQVEIKNALEARRVYVVSYWCGWTTVSVAEAWNTSPQFWFVRCVKTRNRFLVNRDPGWLEDSVYAFKSAFRSILPTTPRSNIWFCFYCLLMQNALYTACESGRVKEVNRLCESKDVDINLQTSVSWVVVYFGLSHCDPIVYFLRWLCCSFRMVIHHCMSRLVVDILRLFSACCSVQISLLIYKAMCVGFSPFRQQ